MTKELHREMIKINLIIIFHNNFLRSKFQEDRLSSEIFAKSLLRTTKKLYFSNLNTKKVIDNRRFRKTVSPLFLTKCSKVDKIILNENDKCLSNDDEICRRALYFLLNIIFNIRYSCYENDSSGRNF